MKADPMDLRLDIERRKYYTTHDFNRDHDVSNMDDCLDSRSERPTEIFSKCLKKSLKSMKKRSRSSSSSSSASSSKSQKEVSPLKSDFKEEGLKTQLNVKEIQKHCDRGRARGGFQIQICGQSWNRDSYQENSSQCNPTNMTKNDNWDPEYTPKSKKYYLHDVRESHVEGKWMDNRGRGNLSRGRARFIIRKANSSPNSKGSKWAQFNGEQKGDTEQVHQGDRNLT